MTINWKLPAYCAGGAFLLSILAGAIGGVRFGTLLLRALIGGSLIGGLAFGIDFLLRQYLPELYEGFSEDGRNVDITIADENPHSNTGDGEQTGESARVERGLPSGDHSIDEGSDDSHAEQDVGMGDDDVSEVEELGSAEGNSKPQTSAESQNASQGASGGDSSSDLPSFDTVEESFKEETASSGPTDDITSVDVMGTGEDPEVVAKAVRTIMKRDQEG